MDVRMSNSSALEALSRPSIAFFVTLTAINKIPMIMGKLRMAITMLPLLALVNAIAKSFITDKSGAGFYFYSLASPTQIIGSKILYGFLLCTGICCAGYLFFSLWLTNPIQDTALFFLVLVLSSFGFSNAVNPSSR